MNTSFTHCVCSFFRLCYCVFGLGRCVDVGLTLSQTRDPSVGAALGTLPFVLAPILFCMCCLSSVSPSSSLFPFQTFLLSFIILLSFKKYFSTFKKDPIIIHKSPSFLILQFHFKNKFINVDWYMIIMPSCHFLMPFPPVFRKNHCFFQANQHYWGVKAQSFLKRTFADVCVMGEGALMQRC